MLYIFLSFLAFFVIGLPYSILMFFRQNEYGKSILEILVLTALFGPLIINYLIFLFGYTGLLSRENLFISILAITLLPFFSKNFRLSIKEFYYVTREQICHINNVWSSLTFKEALSLSLTLSILIITSYSAFTQAPTLRDPYTVWLFYGKKIMETKTIPLYYGNAADISWSGNYPPLISFLVGYYFIGLGQAIPEAVTHVSWLYGGLTLLVTFLLAKELGTRKIALVSACLLTTASLFTLELINYGYTTIAWSFYTTATCFYLVKHEKEKNLRSALLFGLSLGMALLSTYLSLIFVASLIISLILKILVEKTYRKRLVFKPLIIGLLGACIALPWFIRNFVLLGNPVYPWFYEIFGGRGIILELIRRVPAPKYTFYKLLTDNTFFALADEDIGYTLLIFGLVGSLYFIWRREKISAILGWLTFTFFVILLSTMITYYGYERYLMLVAPLLAISGGFFLSKLFSINNAVIKTLILISIVIFSLPNYLYLVSLIPNGAPIGETKLLSYIGKYIDDYLPLNATILTNEIQLYFINRKTINVYNLQGVFLAGSLIELMNSLRVHNVTHILININIDPTTLNETPLIHALTKHKDLFKILLDMYPYNLYEVNYGGFY